MEKRLIFSEQKGWKERLANSKKRVVYNFLNSHDLYQFKNEPLFKKSVSGNENINYIDGFIISLFFSIKKIKRIPRLSGPELITHFFNDAKLSKKGKHLFIGFEREDLNIFSRKFPHLSKRKLYSYNPPYIRGIKFPEEEIKKIAKIINTSEIDFVWVGVGCPKQNILSEELYKLTNARNFFNIGAALDFVLERKSRAPKWIQEIGLEWLYRLSTDFNHSKKKVLRSFISNKYLFNSVILR
jgi:exopolysaccharide biosynthesis WecB/TagA/CpsF family protein